MQAEPEATIPFNRPPYTGNEDQHVLAAMRSDQIAGDGHYSRLCQGWFENALGCRKALLTPSCTQALEMAAILIGIQPGDEVIMPSYTFVSTTNAFVLRGATIVFVDIRPDTLSMDESLVEAAITDRTKAIVPVHYAGVACDMDRIMAIAERHDLFVVEDAAQGIASNYKGRQLGTIGHLAAYSFHETKNLTSGGEGGLLIINDHQFAARAEVIREKGTNRSQFFRGEIDRYSWVDLGSSYLPSEIQAAYLWGQLERIDDIIGERLANWRRYHARLLPLHDSGLLRLPEVPDDCEHNGHMLHIRVQDNPTRTALIRHLRQAGVHAVFHYVPLHTSEAGRRYGRFHGIDRFTTTESDRIIRLPMFFGLKPEEIDNTVKIVWSFFHAES